MPAAPKGSYALLRVYDTWTLTKDLNLIGVAETYADAQSMVRSPVSCEGVAMDLLRQWAQDCPGNASGAKPGVMVIEGDEPTQLELDGLWQTQVTYFRWLVMKADEYWITGKREYITEDHRRALRWLGSEDRDWFKKILAVHYKACPACAEQINIMAVQCRHCQTNLVKFWRDMGVLRPTEDQDPGVFAWHKQQDDLAEKRRLAKEEEERQKAAEARRRKADELRLKQLQRPVTHVAPPPPIESFDLDASAAAQETSGTDQIEEITNE